MKFLSDINDLLKLSDKQIQILLKGAELEEIVYVLKGCSVDLREKFQSNMSKKAVQMLEKKDKELGAVRLKKVEEYQKQFLKLANERLDTDKPKIVIASDHAAFELKEELKKTLTDYEIIDCGTNSKESTDYPDIGFEAAEAVAKAKADKGIIMCGSGIGMSIVANKVKGIRAALCHSTDLARLARKHNNANVLVVPGRFISKYYAKQIMEVFLKTDFDGGRHRRRINKIKNYENEE